MTAKRRPGDLTERQKGYGAPHRKLRRQFAPSVATGTVRCARCRKPIRPGQPWDLGHDDHDRTKYIGPECVPCSRASASPDRRQPPEPVRRWSRDW
jgi:hypothetical protein